MAIPRRSPSVLLRASSPAGSQCANSAAGQPGFAVTTALSVVSPACGWLVGGSAPTRSPLKLGDTNEQSNAKEESFSRQQAWGFSGSWIVLNLVLLSPGATWNGAGGRVGCWAVKLPPFAASSVLAFGSSMSHSSALRTCELLE